MSQKCAFLRWATPSLLSLGLVLGIEGCNGNDAVLATFMANTSATQQQTAANGAASNEVSACDGIRRRLRQDALHQFGADLMVEAMKRVSREISTEERADLRRLTAGNGVGVSAELQSHSAELTQAIYASAMEHAGLHPGTVETHEEIRRTLSANPMGLSLLDDSFTPVLSTSPMNTGTTPAVGSVTDAFLTVDADQSHFKVLFLKVRTVHRNASGGLSTTGEYLTLAQYLETVQPTYCAHVATVLTPDQVNLIAAE